MSERPNLNPEDAMRRAIELSSRGYPAPNPHVGCVIVREGEIVGEGWHEAHGLAHAERNALDQAGDQAKGATAYVTLEPCAHQGLQPPCTAALIAAGVTQVIFAVEDPNPKAQGGAALLRAAGIEVTQGLLEAEATEANRAWLTAHSKKRPYVVAKVAMSLDGRIALPDGTSKWITGPEAREAGHRFRAQMGAVLVGAGTVLKDNPELTARIEGVTNQPRRIHWDPFNKLHSETATHTQSPETLLQELWQQGLTSLLVEGGAWTLSRFLEANLIDQLELFLAPKILGEGLTWANLSLPNPLERNPDWRIVQTQIRGNDLQVSLLSETSQV